MSDPSQETQIALLIAGQKALIEQLEDVENRADKKIAIVESELAALRLERDKALKWGVMTLGSAVVGMAYWILNKIIGGHIQ
jgi:hypothetical protein